MNGRFVKALERVHRGEKGITGLETAIILIAFVTVAAVLAYRLRGARRPCIKGYRRRRRP
jgi:flagellin-like protein